jgi:hypothetical protein
MHPALKTIVLARIALAGTSGASRNGLVVAQEATNPAKSDRGGLLASSSQHQFEVFFDTAGPRFFPQKAEGARRDASKLAGPATFCRPNSPKTWLSRPLHGPTATSGAAATPLDLVIGLGKVLPTGVKVTFEIVGLLDPAELTATSTVPFEFVKVPPEASAAYPMPPQGGVVLSPRYLHAPGYYGFGYPGPESAPPSRSGPAIPLSGYGQVPSASPSSPVPYLSGGHAVSILPSPSSPIPRWVLDNVIGRLAEMSRSRGRG